MNNDIITRNKLFQYKKHMLKNCFYSFFVEAFYYLNPGKSLAQNWHLNYLASILQEVSEGKHKNLIICVPPRSLKSTMISVSWCAWLLGNNPNLRIMCSSYAQKLSTKLSVDTRNLMQSAWYKSYFPEFEFSKDQNTKSKFCSITGGYRLSTSVASSIIGEGGDILICDDPMSPTQAYSKQARDKIYNWYMESFSTRLDNKKNGIKIIVMQRLHDDDLCGRIIKKMKNMWHVISIPAIANKEFIFKSDKYHKIMKINELLNKEHEGTEQLNLMKIQLGSSAFSAQYLQSPIPESGNIIKTNWLQYYNDVTDYDGKIVQSWDLAFTNNDSSDYSVCTTWLIKENKTYLLEVKRYKQEFTELIESFKANYQKFKSNLVIIEDTVASKSFIQHIKSNFYCNIVTSRPKGDKFTRLMSVTPLFESGRVFLPKESDWLADFLDELLNFPQVNHDDQVDSLSQFLDYFSKSNISSGISHVSVL
jgi:predicted phage terminase large subunit-like protein